MVGQCRLSKKGPPEMSSAACRRFLPTALLVNGERHRKGSTATSGLIQRHRWKHFSPGVVSQWTGSSGTKPGRSRCTRRAAHSRLRSASISSSVDDAGADLISEGKNIPHSKRENGLPFRTVALAVLVVLIAMRYPFMQFILHGLTFGYRGATLPPGKPRPGKGAGKPKRRNSWTPASSRSSAPSPGTEA